MWTHSPYTCDDDDDIKNDDKITKKLKIAKDKRRPS